MFTALKQPPASAHKCMARLPFILECRDSKIESDDEKAEPLKLDEQRSSFVPAQVAGGWFTTVVPIDDDDTHTV